jgi:hypothetical protein
MYISVVHRAPLKMSQEHLDVQAGRKRGRWPMWPGLHKSDGYQTLEEPHWGKGLKVYSSSSLLEFDLCRENGTFRIARSQLAENNARRPVGEVMC